MRFSARLTLILSLLCGAAACALAQTSQTNGSSTITGRVMIGDKPAQGIVVTLMPANEYRPDRKAVARATTDADGQFRLLNVAAGRYEVVPVAPVFVVEGGTNGYRNRGKSVNLSDGETVEKIDFTLVRGGVITGRVTDAEGRPVIGENVMLSLAGEGNNRGGQFFSSFMFQTDDRGIYRIYGIPPGRYLVSVGQDGRNGGVRMSFGRAGFFPRTFHPGVIDETKATVLEVTEGSEATNVDIPLGHRMTTYTVSGTVVDAETGKPVPNMGTVYGVILEGEHQIHSFGMGARTDAEGHFRFEGVLPGHYAAFAAPDTTADSYSANSYSPPAMFEVNESDFSGLVIKLRRGSSISGTALIEGASDRSILAKLSQLRIAYWPETEGGMTVPVMGQGERINADGSFRISGLRPGKVRLMLGGWPPPKGFALLRVERDGVEQRAGIVEVAAGEQVAGVRLVFEYGTGIVRGQVRVENGTLSEGARLYVSARRPTTSETSLPGAEVDARGRFVMEGLPPGQYQLRLGGRLGPNGPLFKPVLQNISVTNGVETEVTLVIELNAQGEPEKP